MYIIKGEFSLRFAGQLRSAIAAWDKKGATALVLSLSKDSN